MKNLTVVMLTTRFYPDHGGGALQALYLCQKLAERGVKTFVITGHQARETTTEQVKGIPVTRLPLAKKLGIGLLPLYFKRLSLLIARRREYDLIHAHAVAHHSYAGFLAGRLLGKPAIAKIAGLNMDTPERIRARRYGNVQTRFLSLATTLVATTQELHDQTTRQGIPAGRLVTIPNGTDTRQFHPVGSAARKRIRQALGLPQNALLATFVGAIRRVKGIDVLAKAWPRLATAVPDLHVCLAGPYRPEEHWGVSSTYVNELRRQFAQSPKHEKRVHFTGQVSNVIDYLHATDIFVFPSRSEGMPNALLEAMSCGLPFVATHLGSISEMAPSEQHPYLVPVDDPETLADALLALAGDPALRRRLGAANRQVVQTRYSLDAVAGHYIALYRTLIK